MNAQTNFKPEEQVSLFDLFAAQFPVPEAQAKPKALRRATSQPVAKLEEQMEFMLDVLETPDAILDAPENWTDEDIAEMRIFMLFRHLRFILDGRNGSQMIDEIWDWILDDHVLPFSFSVCVHEFAKTLGLADAENTSIDTQSVRFAFYFMAQRAGRKPAFSLIP